ncbi:MarR family transcriptional regulator [Micromonospora sp. NPDC000207]|uniref:MarR family winged helix-turn-helix transcriptional regulator n=1 Tax=Micromonospora sp. NPDC000207 TaxID=3154246 RepID=UPI0033190E07
MTGHLVLRQQVCFALYAAQRALTDVYRPILDEFGLTYPQYLALLVLWEHADDRSDAASADADAADANHADVAAQVDADADALVADTGVAGVEADGLTVSELGAALRLDSGTLSPLLKRLEAAGLVVRRRSARDERRVTVRLSDTGRGLREQMCAVPLRVALATGLSEAELVALRDTLNQVTNTIHQAKEQ